MCLDSVICCCGLHSCGHRALQLPELRHVVGDVRHLGPIDVWRPILDALPGLFPVPTLISRDAHRASIGEIGAVFIVSGVFVEIPVIVRVVDFQIPFLVLCNEEPDLIQSAHRGTVDVSSVERLFEWEIHAERDNPASSCGGFVAVGGLLEEPFPEILFKLAFKVRYDVSDLAFLEREPAFPDEISVFHIMLF